MVLQHVIRITTFHTCDAESKYPYWQTGPVFPQNQHGSSSSISSFSATPKIKLSTWKILRLITMLFHFTLWSNFSFHFQAPFLRRAHSFLPRSQKTGLLLSTLPSFFTDWSCLIRKDFGKYSNWRKYRNSGATECELKIPWSNSR